MELVFDFLLEQAGSIGLAITLICCKVFKSKTAAEKLAQKRAKLSKKATKLESKVQKLEDERKVIDLEEEKINNKE